MYNGDMDKDKFDNAIWNLYMLEVRLRNSGNPVQADEVMNIRIQLKESVKDKKKENDSTSQP